MKFSSRSVKIAFAVMLMAVTWLVLAERFQEFLSNRKQMSNLNAAEKALPDFRRELWKDARFSHLEVQVATEGGGGLTVLGRVASLDDLEDLKGLISAGNHPFSIGCRGTLVSSEAGPK